MIQQVREGTYGYRRVQVWLERREIYINRKAVLRIMNKYGLLGRIRRRRKYRQMGELLHRYPNVLNRNFFASRPNEKWVTDISYIQTPQGTLYLSIIRDLFDNSIVAYEMGTEQSVHLVLRTIQQAREKFARLLIQEYIHFYTHERIWRKTKLTPLANVRGQSIQAPVLYYCSLVAQNPPLKIKPAMELEAKKQNNHHRRLDSE